MCKCILSVGGGGHEKFWGSFYAVGSSYSHTDGGPQNVSTLKKRGGGGGGAQKVLPCLEGAAKSFRPAVFPFCSPPPSP